MTSPSPSSNGQTRLAYILEVPLAPDCQRQWPQMGEVVHGRDLIGQVEGGFPELTLGVGRRLHSTTSSSSGLITMATDAYTATSASPNCSTARRSKSPTTGANPPPHPNGADHVRTAWTCRPTESGKTQSISPITDSLPEPAPARVGLSRSY